MSTYQQQPGWTPGWGGAPAPLGHPALQQTAAPHLRPGEALLGVFAIALDPLLPLYSVNWEQTGSDLLWAPVRLLVRFLRGFWRGLCTYFMPRWLVEILMPDLLYRRPYGLRLERRAYRAIRRPLHGGSWSGGENSMAWAVWKAVRTTPGETLKADHDDFTLVLTDQRMLLLSRMWGHERHETYRATGLLELPRGTYGLRRDTPNSIVTRRLDLSFSDGSWIALDLQSSDEAEQGLKALLG
ncbi:hypothetical protein [Kitasatospora sp. MAP5-34]|uniref:hypothetical protein n=1 Tax=Kitasatospora sp. MAP5-34 TaxID=3035102 RepID=UPI0024756EA0|nr:hypothetical protein [Kitasatospora sp. MAP5-34]MDH6577978.1 hypothetical protein [Kitasatospora sp. MAP5-34]